MGGLNEPLPPHVLFGVLVDPWKGLRQYVVPWAVRPMNIRKRAVVPLTPIVSGLKPFDVIIYGATVQELMTVPNDIISALAAKYPDYTSSLFALKDDSELYHPGKLVSSNFLPFALARHPAIR